MRHLQEAFCSFAVLVSERIEIDRDHRPRNRYIHRPAMRSRVGGGARLNATLRLTVQQSRSGDTSEAGLLQ